MKEKTPPVLEVFFIELTFLLLRVLPFGLPLKFLSSTINNFWGGPTECHPDEQRLSVKTESVQAPDRFVIRIFPDYHH